MSADGVPEPVEMCHEDVEDYAGHLLDGLREQVATLERQLAAARKALAQSQAQNVRLARMALNVPDEAPAGYLNYAPRFPSPTRMHSPL